MESIFYPNNIVVNSHPKRILAFLQLCITLDRTISVSYQIIL